MNEPPGDWFQIDEYFEKIVHEPLKLVDESSKPTENVKSKKKKKSSKKRRVSNSLSGNLPGIRVTVGENIIATIKIRKNYGAIQSFIFSILL